MSETSDENPAWDPDGILPEELRDFFERQAENAYGRLRTDFRIVAYTQILWCNWECDFGIVLIEIDGERKNLMLASVGNQSPAAMLRDRLEAYREAIKSTEHFLAKLQEAAND